ncbi:CBM35 domain-containing protein, partial [Nonomuraea purpurea]
MYGGMQPGFWNDGAHGVITVQRGGAKTQYVHVLTKPSTDQVRLRDNGYRVTKVSDLRTGEQLRFTQSGGYLSILGITKWDDYDTVFKVETAGRQGFLTGIKAGASAEKAGHPAGALVDGSFENYWDSDGQLPVSLTLDLGKPKKIAYLGVNQREWSPTYARVTFGRPEDSARIKDYRVYVSDDGKRWGTPVRAGAMPSARGMQIIDVGEQRARYVKLEVLNTWAGTQAPRFHGNLRIDEIQVADSYPVSRDTLPLEAERQQRTGKARVERCAACSGAAQVTGLRDGTLTYRDVTVPAAGEYRLRIDHTSPTPATLSVAVNGAAPVQVRVPGDNKGVPASTSLPVPLKAGPNTITLSGDAGVDRIAVAPMPPDSYVPKTTLTVDPSGLQWAGPGQQTLRVSATLRLDSEDVLDEVALAPVAPAGWTAKGETVKADALRLGQSMTGSWTLTSPPGQDVSAADIPITATFRSLGRPSTVTSQVGVRPRPADRVFMREAEDSRNQIGEAGITNCAACSGGQKVRNIGGGPDQGSEPNAYVLFEDVTVPEAKTYTLSIDFTVNGDRSFFVTVNGGKPIEVKVSGVGNTTLYTTSVPVTLRAGSNTIKFHNDTTPAPDLDRISLG